MRAHDRPTGGRRREPGGLNHWQAKAISALPGHVANRQPDPRLQPHTIERLLIERPQRLLYRDRRRDRIGGSLECRHQAVATTLDHNPTVPNDGRGHQLVVQSAQRVLRAPHRATYASTSSRQYR